MSILILNCGIFPAWRHNALGESKIVYSQQECEALGGDWADTPMAFEDELPDAPEDAVGSTSDHPASNGPGVSGETVPARKKPGPKPKAKG